MTRRRSLLALGASVPARMAMAQASPRAAEVPASAGAAFADPDFGFTAHIVLGASYYGGSDPGKLLAVISRIKPGDYDSAYSAYYEAGTEARKLAQQAAAGRQGVSARQAYLWAATYFAAALRLVDGTRDAQRALPCWKDYAACWQAAAALFDPPAERIAIAYEGAALTGWFLRADGSGRRKPLVILNNGADGLETSMMRLGGAGGLARGYNCLIFNGPGQGDSLWERGLYFRPDWEKVITPVVDAMVHHPEVDAKRMILIGASMGGFWVPRALAFEHRIAAGVADPGVWDVSEPYRRNLPPLLIEMLRDQKKEAFDRVMQMGVEQNSRARGMARMRMRPFGMSSFYDVWQASQQYRLAEVAGAIRCPLLITDPEGEQFFPGQSQKLYDALACPKKLIHFTQEQGAGQHCEAAAPGLRDYYIYNWLAEVLG